MECNYLNISALLAKLATIVKLLKADRIENEIVSVSMLSNTLTLIFLRFYLRNDSCGICRINVTFQTHFGYVQNICILLVLVSIVYKK